MKTMSLLSMCVVALMLSFAGCGAGDAVTDVAGGAMNQLKDLSGIDFGVEGLADKISGVTDGFKDVTADNVEGLATKVTELDSAVGEIDAEALPAPAKGALGGVSKMIESAMGGISDEGIMGKLKPAVEPLLEKLKAFM